MLGWLNLLFSLLFPSLVEWWLRWNVAADSLPEFRGQDLAKALAALAGILILGLGGILIIGLSGRSLRRLYFSNNFARSGKSTTATASPDWARPRRQDNDVAGTEDQPGRQGLGS